VGEAAGEDPSPRRKAHAPAKSNRKTKEQIPSIKGKGAVISHPNRNPARNLNHGHFAGKDSYHYPDWE